MKDSRLALLSTTVFCLATPAVAQNNPPPPSSTPSPAASSSTPPPAGLSSTPRPAGASAPSGRDADVALGDIVVTARRVEERLQDVPISITVFNNKQIAERNLVGPTDLVIYTPSLSTTSTYGRDNTQYVIRGFSQADRTTAAVAVYFADVVAPRSGPSVTAGDGAGPGQFLDLSNVQVLKGPQGTLFGRNTTGGAVLLVPQKPTSQLEGYVEGLYGSYDWKGAQGVINVPLGDSARLRIAGDFQDRDGLTRNFGIGGDFDDRHYVALRASLVVDLTPDLENYSIISYNRSRTNGSANALIACDLSAGLLPLLACSDPKYDQLALQKANGVHSAGNDLADPFNRRTQWSVINTTTWKASDDVTVKNIASYTQLTSSVRYDVFSTQLHTPSIFGPLGGIPVSFFDVISPPGAQTVANQYTLTDELQLQGHTAGDRLVYQAGAYFERSAPLGGTGLFGTSLASCTSIEKFQCTDVLGEVFGAPVGGLNQLRSSIAYRNVALYAQSTYSLNDRLKLTAGVRYTWDKARGTAEPILFRLPAPNTPVASCLNGIDITADPTCRRVFVKSSHAPTWLIDLDYHPNDDILLYAKYARGYRQGGVSADAAAGYQTFDPEKVDAYEAGTKLTFRAPVRGYLNVTGFYNNLTNQQLAFNFVPETGSGFAVTDGVVNAGKSRIYGAEVEFAVNPVRGLTLNGSYAYLRTKLISIADVVAQYPYSEAGPTVIAGQDLNYSPHNKFSVGGDYQLPIDQNLGQVTLGAIYSYTGKQLGSATAGPYAAIPSYGTLNLTLNWTNVMSKPIDLALFATNVTNKKYITNVFGVYDSVGLEFAQYGEQRVVGAKLRYHFGS